MGIIKCVISSQRLVVEQKGLKLEVLSVYSVLFNVKFPKSVWGRPVYFRFSPFQQSYMLKTAGRREKRSTIWAMEYVLTIYGVLLTVKCSKSVWGRSLHFRFFPIFMKLVSPKRLVVKQNCPQFGPHCTYVYGVILPDKSVSVWRHWTHFGYVPIFNNLESRQRLVKEGNGLQFSLRGYCWVYTWCLVKCSISLGGYSIHVWLSTQPFISKTVCRKSKRTKMCAFDVAICCI